MRWTVLILFITFFATCYEAVHAQLDDEEEEGGFTVPDTIIEVFRPRGLRVSIPHQPGIQLFAFHGNINTELNGKEPGQLSKEIKRHTNGFWTYFDSTAKIKPGDVIFYWTYVDYNDGHQTVGYASDEQNFIVGALKPISQINTIPKPVPTQKPPATTTTTTTTTVRPTKTNKKPPPKQGQGCAVRGLTEVNGKKVCQGQVIFEENFVSLDRFKWKPEVKIASQPDYEFCIYMNHPENVVVKNGNLYLKPTLSVLRFGEDFLDTNVNLGRNCTGVPGTVACSKTAVGYQILPPVLGGQISTKDTFSFLYGKVEIRAKLPKGQWVYPILYLQPKNSDYGLNYDSGQMRIAFTPGNDDLGKQLSGGVVLSPSDEGRNYGMRYSQSDEHWGNLFHTYVLKWQPGLITVSVDGNEYGRIEPPEGGFATEANNLDSSAGERWKEGSPMAPFDKEMYLTLGVAAGGFSFADRVGKPWKNINPKNMLNFWRAKDTWYKTWNDNSALKVDYVKITAY